MELTKPDSSWEDIMDLYHNVYQQLVSQCVSAEEVARLMLCDEEMEVHIHQETLDSVKEHLWHKWFSALPGEELRWIPAGVPRLNPQANFQARNHDRFMNVRQDSCKEALAIAREPTDRSWWPQHCWKIK